MFNVCHIFLHFAKMLFNLTLKYIIFRANYLNIRQFSSLSEYSGILQLETRDHVRWITMNRPTQQNAWNLDSLEQLTEALIGAQNDTRIHFALLTGNGTHFSSGLDLLDMRKEAQDRENHDPEKSINLIVDTIECFTTTLIDFPKPLIAVVNGPAVGGSASVLPLFDYVIASDSASFTSFVPQFCATYTLPKILGLSHASSILMFNRNLTVEEALKCGLVSRVVKEEQLKYAVTKWLYDDGLVRNAQNRIQDTKALIRNSEVKNSLHRHCIQESDLLRQNLKNQRNESKNLHKLNPKFSD